MPNPLSLLTSQPSGPAKTNEAGAESQESASSATFQQVLEQSLSTRPQDSIQAELPEEASEIPEEEVDSASSPDIAAIGPQIDAPKSDVSVGERTETPPQTAVEQVASDPALGVILPAPGSPAAEHPTQQVVPVTTQTLQTVAADQVPRHAELPRPSFVQRANANRAETTPPPVASDVKMLKPMTPVERHLESVLLTTPSPQKAEITPPTLQHAAMTVAELHVRARGLAGSEGRDIAALDAESTAALRESQITSPSRDGLSGLNSPVHRGDTARAISGQMVAALQSSPGGGDVEIALNPKELGRVSIVLTNRDDGMHLAIAAERPETLDLMRRHISVLTGEFQKLGYRDLSFDLGTSPDGQKDRDSTPETASTLISPTDSEPQNTPTARQLALSEGIDIRL